MKYIMVSRFFPKGHPREGKPTWFVEKIWKSLWDDHQGASNPLYPYWLQYDQAFPVAENIEENIHQHQPKHHTIRPGARFSAGETVSLRVWSDKPYRSKQIEFARVEVKKVWPFIIHEVGGETIWQIPGVGCGKFDSSSKGLQIIARNDGLEPDDFVDWFKIHPKNNGDARSWKPSDFDKQFHRKYTIAFVACFPVCTNLSGSGSQDWGHGKAEPLKCLPMLMDGLMLFNSCEQIADWSGAPYFLENPVGCIPTHHRKWDYIFQPWNYGDLWTKKTCIWAGNGFVMPKFLYETEPPGVVEKIWLASPGDNRQDERSETPAGFARAVFEANKNHCI